MSPPFERARCERGIPPDGVLARAGSILREGGLAVLPTETVYGLAARADDERAVARLRAAKGRDAERALTWHVGSADVLERFEHLPAVVGRLAARYWPGPLTLVLAGVPAGLERVARDGWTGLRYPAQEATAALLAGLDFPVVMTSANPSGEAAATTADEAVRGFEDAVAFVLDAGPARLGEASGVLRVGPGRFELLREGLLPVEDLRRTAGLAIGFACTGNTCRSPMAEGLARRELVERLSLPAGTAGEERDAIARFGFSVSSVGVLASHGAPATKHAIDCLAARGIDIAEHASRTATAERIASLDRVYALTASHADALRNLLPPGRAEHLELLDPSGADVADPIGGDAEVYRRCAAEIAAAVAMRARAWV